MVDISIITATRNSANILRSCIDSVVNQSIGVEHIVIDGKSSDETLSILEANRASISKIVSEPDEGIYHAMNKGLGLITGEVVGMLNFDDCYASGNILQTVLEAFRGPAIDACNGDLVYVDDKDRVVRSWRSGDYNPGKFYWGWMPPHPTFKKITCV